MGHDCKVVGIFGASGVLIDACSLLRRSLLVGSVYGGGIASACDERRVATSKCKRVNGPSGPTLEPRRAGKLAERRVISLLEIRNPAVVETAPKRGGGDCAARRNEMVAEGRVVQPFNRRALLVGAGAGALGFMFGGAPFVPSRVQELPSAMGGTLRVELGVSHLGIPTAEAQGYYNARLPAGDYYAYYAAMARMQRLQWLQYQQAVAAYQQYLRELQGQYAWIGQSQQVTFQQATSEFAQGGYQLSEMPYVMDMARSVYGFARSSGLDKVVMYGVSKLNRPTWIKHALPAAGALWDALGTYLAWDQPRKEKAIAPQNKEAPVKVSLPDGALLDGQGYLTLDGGVAVTNQPVTDYNTGKTGPLAKVFAGAEPKYLVI